MSEHHHSVDGQVPSRGPFPPKEQKLRLVQVEFSGSPSQSALRCQPGRHQSAWRVEYLVADRSRNMRTEESPVAE